MDTDRYYYEPARGDLRNDPLYAIVGPRPIGWISTLAGLVLCSGVLSTYALITPEARSDIGPPR